VTSILDADSRLQCDAAETHYDDTAEDDDDVDDAYGSRLVASVSGEPLYDSDITITSPGDSEELRTHHVPETTNWDAGMMQSRGARLDSVTSKSGDQDYQLSDLRDPAEDCRSSGIDEKVRREDVSVIHGYHAARSRQRK